MSELFSGIAGYIYTHQNLYYEAFKTHLFIGGSVISSCVVLGIPLGTLAAKKAVFSTGIINFFSALKMIPSLALLMVFIPVIGTGFWPAFFALVLHGLPTMLIGAYTGIKEVDAAVLESAGAMGMTKAEIFRKVELPLALPLIYAGLRTTTIDVIASATLAAYIGAGGLGTFIVQGLFAMDFIVIMVGSFSIALITLSADFLFFILLRVCVPYQRG
jgi:osmoprotectant transport system permease protein